MKNPKTKEEAKTTRYNRWSGNPKGMPHDEKYCAAEVHEQGRGALFYQCRKKPGHGPDGLYCSSHAKRLFPGAGVTWYRTTSWTGHIEPVNVTAETEHFVLIDGCKAAKKDRETQYWPTYEAACEYLISRSESKIRNAELAIQEHTDQIKELRNALAARNEKS